MRVSACLMRRCPAGVREYSLRRPTGVAQSQSSCISLKRWFGTARLLLPPGSSISSIRPLLLLHLVPDVASPKMVTTSELVRRGSASRVCQTIDRNDECFIGQCSQVPSWGAVQRWRYGRVTKDSA